MRFSSVPIQSKWNSNFSGEGGGGEGESFDVLVKEYRYIVLREEKKHRFALNSRSGKVILTTRIGIHQWMRPDPDHENTDKKITALGSNIVSSTYRYRTVCVKYHLHIILNYKPFNRRGNTAFFIEVRIYT
jgi:hypothetical protein